MPRLRRADPSKDGFSRRRRGRGFQYFETSGRTIDDPKVLERIRSLAIPPAWEDVWISPDANGHLQAVGADAAGRKQYLYHERWRRRRDQEKFDRMIAFARRLPALRRRVLKDLAGQGMPKRRVLACAVRLLDLGFFRIGSEAYADANGSFGLATLQKGHVSVNATRAEFDYRAKGGQRRVQEVRDPPVLPVLRALKRRRGGGHELLAYRARGKWVDVRTSDINEYIKEHTRDEHTAKDFRTWNGTLLAAVALGSGGGVGRSQRARTRQIREAVEAVASYLGNTPAVCRQSYIDPRVIDCFEAGETIHPALDRRSGIDPRDPATLHGAIEKATIELLESNAETALAA